MHESPSTPRRRPAFDRPSWGGLLASYALAAAFPLALWAVSRPLAGTVALAATAGLYVGARRASELVRCVYDCQALTLAPVGNVRITVTRPRVDDPR